jgi:molybdenum cofactor biosynthesis enzyme
MCPMKKTRAKEQAKRVEIQDKAKMTRAELGSALLKGVRAEQLDTVPEDSMSAKNRVSRLASLGAAKALHTREDNVKGKCPPFWEKILSPEASTIDWRAISDPVDVIADIKAPTAKGVVEMKWNYHSSIFRSKCYDDEDMFKVVEQAYRQGAEDAISLAAGDHQFSFKDRITKVVEAHRNILGFLLDDFSIDINPVASLTVRELVDRIVLYFIECDLVKKFYTVPGLAFYIGFATRQAFFEFIEDNPSSIHAYVLNRAVTYIESERVADMLYGGGLMTGHKLDLATNFNYNDAGRKEAPQASTNITVNNNTLSMNGMPPKAKSIEEWQSWYVQNEADKKTKIAEDKAAIAAEEAISSESQVIDVTP